MECVVYLRVSTNEQNPESQYVVIEEYCKKKGLTIVERFEDRISGSVPPLERPGFLKMLRYCLARDIRIIVMYDLTRFYRAESLIEAISTWRLIMDKYKVIIEFASEPEFQDPLLRELWLVLKTLFSTFERIMISKRTKYGMERLRKEGKLFHRPSIEYYYAAWLFNKNIDEVTKDEVEMARKQLIKIVEKYWYNKRIKRTQIPEILAENELREMYIRFPKAPRSYKTFARLLKRIKKQK